MVWHRDAAKVGVWVPGGDGPDWTWQRADVIEAFTVRAFDRVRDEARGADMALDAVEVIRDPQTVVSLAIAALVEVAMVHAGVPLTAAKLIGDVAGRLGRSLLAEDPGGDRGPAVRYVDFDYDDTGRTSPEKPEIQRADRVSPPDATGELLDRGGVTRSALVEPVPPNLSRGTSPDTRSLPPDLGRLKGAMPNRNRGSRGGRTDRGGLEDL